MACWLGSQWTRHTVNSSHRKIVWRVDHCVWWHCDKLTILFDRTFFYLAFVAFKSFAVVDDFDIAHAAITCHVVHVCATSCFFSRLICMFHSCREVVLSSDHTWSRVDDIRRCTAINYAVRVEHCFWMVPDRHADKKLRLVAARLWRVDW